MFNYLKKFVCNIFSSRGRRNDFSNASCPTVNRRESQQSEVQLRRNAMSSMFDNDDRNETAAPLQDNGVDCDESAQEICRRKRKRIKTKVQKHIPTQNQSQMRTPTNKRTRKQSKLHDAERQPAGEQANSTIRQDDNQVVHQEMKHHHYKNLKRRSHVLDNDKNGADSDAIPTKRFKIMQIEENIAVVEKAGPSENKKLTEKLPTMMESFVPENYEKSIQRNKGVKRRAADTSDMETKSKRLKLTLDYEENVGKALNIQSAEHQRNHENEIVRRTTTQRVVPLKTQKNFNIKSYQKYVDKQHLAEEVKEKSTRKTHVKSLRNQNRNQNQVDFVNGKHRRLADGASVAQYIPTKKNVKDIFHNANYDEGSSNSLFKPIGDKM